MKNVYGCKYKYGEQTPGLLTSMRANQSNCITDNGTHIMRNKILESLPGLSAVLSNCNYHCTAGQGDPISTRLSLDNIKVKVHGSMT